MKVNQQLSILAGGIALFLNSCAKPAEAPKPIDMDALKMDIQKMEDAFAAGEKAKDAAAVAAYYSDDAISYGRNSEPVSGKAAIQAKIAEDIAKDSTNNSNVYKVVDIFAEGNMAVEIGSWTRLDSAGTETKKGHYMSVFQKRDGKYVCIRDMNVSSTPDKKN
ncbi:MAG: nuclear transport factor 2 family protein [Saprospiraceae bacterium]|nr:nuclear transport factor 2 family protein [Candidatus Vicinibacter affinis]MBP6173127.1 nuclear transport factor 2 family protein [Saprospiraceae bacterium]MBK6822039.1 nuclear transport factor 2 family protein [Candidatus Vicinibacter affinis]MBK7302163.1 nuclear transport factor 2 family protein [Candidatus Vicinibacter affinis]MBK7798111.1 nuclear transport factor 2 family protein [Candidatus Vicinibacter affinis]